jgi:hypothetical protein
MTFHQKRVSLPSPSSSLSILIEPPHSVLQTQVYMPIYCKASQWVSSSPSSFSSSSVPQYSRKECRWRRSWDVVSMLLSDS